MDISQTKDMFFYQISTAEIVMHSIFPLFFSKGEYDMRCMVRLPFFTFRDSQYVSATETSKVHEILDLDNRDYNFDGGKNKGVDQPV